MSNDIAAKVKAIIVEKLGVDEDDITRRIEAGESITEILAHHTEF